ncbi:hypothetical protein [Endozoicomonas atrinae]|uniref:hypothetical protein n=1 Tax=Endozoicomonas atrinae TaxID=1333660 RepID=UPI003B0093D1
MNPLYVLLAITWTAINTWLLKFPVTDHLLSEQGAFEQLQNLLNLLSMVTFTLCMLMKREDKKHLQACLLALMSLSILLREIEIQDFGLPALITWLGHGTGRTLLLLMLWSIALYYARSLFSTFGKTVKRAFCYPSAWFYLMGIVFLFAGMFFDKQWLTAPAGLPTVWMEEILETNGYLLMLFSAFFFMTEQVLMERYSQRPVIA